LTCNPEPALTCAPWLVRVLPALMVSLPAAATVLVCAVVLLLVSWLL